MSKVLIVNSSCRKKSNSRLLAERVAEGAREKGHQVDVVEIGGLTIKPCTGCEGCLAPAATTCVIKDDMQQLYPRFAEADIVILSSPIYWFNLCGQIKQFIDRLYALNSKKGPDGKEILAGRAYGAVLVYGDTDPVRSGGVNAIRSLQDICAYLGAKWHGAVYGSAYGEGDLAENEVLMEEAREFGRGL